MWNKDGGPEGYDYQKPETSRVTIRTGPQPSPRPLSRQNAEKIERAVKQIEKKQGKGLAGEE
jgi:hypothetical protein